MDDKVIKETDKEDTVVKRKQYPVTELPSGCEDMPESHKKLLYWEDFGDGNRILKIRFELIPPEDLYEETGLNLFLTKQIEIPNRKPLKPLALHFVEDF